VLGQTKFSELAEKDKELSSVVLILRTVGFCTSWQTCLIRWL